MTRLLPQYTPGPPIADRRSNLVRAERITWFGLAGAYELLASAPVRDAEPLRRRVVVWRARWEKALRDLDQDRGAA